MTVIQPKSFSDDDSGFSSKAFCPRNLDAVLERLGDDKLAAEIAAQLTAGRLAGEILADPRCLNQILLQHLVSEIELGNFVPPRSVVDKLSELLGVFVSQANAIAASIETHSFTYKSISAPAAKNEAFAFKLPLSIRGLGNLEDLLNVLVGPDQSRKLIEDMVIGKFKVNRKAPLCCEAVIFPDSELVANGLTPEVRRAPAFKMYGYKRETLGEQERIFKESGYELASGADAILISAALLRKARSVGLDVSSETWRAGAPKGLADFDRAEVLLLTRLVTGEMRFNGGNIWIGKNGELNLGMRGPSDGAWFFGRKP